MWICAKRGKGLRGRVLSCGWDGALAAPRRLRPRKIVFPRAIDVRPARAACGKARKLIGTVALIALVVAWTLLATALAQVLAVAGHPLVEALYYLVAGLGWVVPAMPLISWMSRPNARDSANAQIRPRRPA